MAISIEFANSSDFDEIDALLAEISSAIVAVGENWSNYKVGSEYENRKRFSIRSLIVGIKYLLQSLKIKL